MTDLLFGGLQSEERILACAKGFVAFQEYIAKLIEERRMHPQNDELHALMDYQITGEPPLSQVELINAVMGFLAVSHRSTLDVFGNGFFLLLQTPSLWQSLCERPELIPSAVEEILRFDTSANAYPHDNARG